MMTPALPAYPNRDRFFAYRVIRLMSKTAAAQAMGAEACWLVAIVAMQEDVKRYTEPAKYYNEQLAPIVGCKSRSAFERIRRRAVDAGWLIYIPGSTYRAGQYWVTIPPHAEGFSDTACDESAPVSTLEIEQVDEHQNGHQQVYPSEIERSTGLNPSVQPGATRAPSTSVPNSNPPPTPKDARIVTRFVKPTFDEVAAYCSERKNTVDPQTFLDHYESNGWHVGKNPMKDWRAAVRTWERNGVNKSRNGHALNGAGQVYNSNAHAKDPNHGKW